MTSPAWRAVAADGTDPDELAHVVALTVDTRAARLYTEHDDGPARARRRWRDAAVGADARARGAAAADTWRGLGVRVALVGDPGYPPALVAGLPHGVPPPWLAWQGPAGGVPDRPTVALVGARRASGYGTGVAAWLADAAGRAGAHVVSGGAVGIDAAAHDAALATAGGTTVVLGCGHDVPYPRPHSGRGRLFDRVLAAGGTIVSEQLPGARAVAGRVLARNRIVAGLAEVVVVVEGGARSGTLRTATEAAERGVAVLAVPGDVRAPGSVAPHRLLSEGASPCTGPADLLAALTDLPGAPPDPPPADGAPGSRGRAPGTDPGTGQHAGPLPAALHAVLAAAWPRPRRVDALVRTSGLGVGQVLAALTAARVAGVVVEGADGHRLARAP